MTSSQISPELADRLGRHFAKRMRETVQTNPEITLKDFTDQIFAEGNEIAAQLAAEADGAEKEAKAAR